MIRLTATAAFHDDHYIIAPHIHPPSCNVSETIYRSVLLVLRTYRKAFVDSNLLDLFKSIVFVHF